MEVLPPVLAKRPSGGESTRQGATLIGHTHSVLETFRLMFGSREMPTRLAVRWMRFFGLPAKLFDVFCLNCIAACGLHDLGKANQGFQDAVIGARNAQAIRHEHLSALLLAGPAFQHWFDSVADLHFNVVASAVLSHHLKADSSLFPVRPNPDLRHVRVLRHAVADVTELTCSTVGAPPLDCSSITELWNLESGAYMDLVEDVRHRLIQFKKQLRRDVSSSRLLMAVRTALIVADSGGSALMREHKDLELWLNTAFDESQLIGGSYIESQIISRRISQITNAGQTFRPNSFQDAAEDLGDRALLLAPCGSGKTLAAWRWIKAHLQRNPKRRALFLYPTRGTATEGFRDYVSWAPETDAALVHGTAAYELEGMFQDAEEERSGRDYTTEDRLFAVGYWPRRIFSATVHQFLGFMQNVYRSTCLVPAIADSIVVIDEVHSFDRNLFSALKLFLKNFNLPVLCMTASLPLTRIADLEECGLEVFPQDPSQFEELQESADMPRYRVRVVEGPKEAASIVETNRSSERRTLWVVNQVQRCQELARELGALCYHGRFKLEDRRNRHAQVIKSFQQTETGALAVTTQVCEMSLDLDAQVLISETAPITSLIQRMGRCNRRAKPGDSNVGEVFLYRPEKNIPYRQEELQGLNEFLEALDGKEVSQSFLQQLLEEFGPREVEVERYSSFLECGPWAVAREESLVEEQDWTVQTILDADVEQYLTLRRARRPTEGLILPCPRRLARIEPRVGAFLRVAPVSHYSQDYGLCDEPLGVDK